MRWTPSGTWPSRLLALAPWFLCAPDHMNSRNLRLRWFLAGLLMGSAGVYLAVVLI